MLDLPRDTIESPGMAALIDAETKFENDRDSVRANVVAARRQILVDVVYVGFRTTIRLEYRRV